MTNVLVVYKKNFESIHDESLERLKSILYEMRSTHQLRVELRARERVRRADFIGRDLVIVLGGDGTCLLYTSPSPRDLSTSRMPSSA